MDVWMPFSTIPKGRMVKLKGPGWTASGSVSEDGGLYLKNLEMRGPGMCGKDDITHWAPLNPPASTVVPDETKQDQSL